ncbi:MULTISPECIES: TRAP transporter substrate-binding protein [Acutalibacteraceae]|uniref:TRAP transporter substrate-binding protein n=1 Tax=Acutalibacteraceae TaxID=3082771 RepID=UPI001FA9CBB5|nr:MULTISPECIES: TRAP transporter substrate-binding protein [Acutalibacteraceae]
MKSKFGKLTCLVLAALMVASVGTGCSSGTSSGTGSAGGTASTTAGGSGNAKYSLLFGLTTNEDDPWSKAAVKFADTVKEKSKGQIEVKVYPNNQLGAETDVIQAVQNGTADMLVTGETLQKWAPLAAMVAVPYLVKDEESLNKLASGSIGKEIEDEISQKAGMYCLTYFVRGPRELTANKEIKTPADLKGLRLRIPNAPLYIKPWESAGAKPTPMALTEVFTALQQNTIDAEENPFAMIKSNNFQEVQKYCMMTDHVRSWIYVTIGKKKFDSMPADLQKVVTDAAAEMQTYENQLFEKSEKDDRAWLEQKGMKFVDVDQDAFEKAMTPGVLSTLNDEQKKVYDEIKATFK